MRTSLIARLFRQTVSMPNIMFKQFERRTVRCGGDVRGSLAASAHSAKQAARSALVLEQLGVNSLRVKLLSIQQFGSQTVKTKRFARQAVLADLFGAHPAEVVFVKDRSPSRTIRRRGWYLASCRFTGPLRRLCWIGFVKSIFSEKRPTGSASSEPASRLLLSTATPCIPAFPRSARPARDAHQAWLSLPPTQPETPCEWDI